MSRFDYIGLVLEENVAFLHWRFHIQGPHKEFAMNSNISLPKVVKSVYFDSF